MPPRKRARASTKTSYKRRYGAAATPSRMARPRRSLALEVKRVVERMAEHKSVTFQTALGTDYAAANTIGLANLTIGALRNQRLGSHVRWSKLKLNFICATGSIGGAGIIGQPSRMRFMVVEDKAVTGGAAAAGVAPSLANVVIDPTAARSFYSHYNPSTVSARFNVLYDKMIALNVGGGVTDQALGKIWSIDQKINVHTTYVDGANAGTVADIQKGGLWLFTTSDQTGLLVPNAAVHITLEYFDET